MILIINFTIATKSFLQAPRLILKRLMMIMITPRGMIRLDMIGITTVANTLVWISSLILSIWLIKDELARSSRMLSKDNPAATTAPAHTNWVGN